jgi:hypothetical protein
MRVFWPPARRPGIFDPPSAPAPLPRHARIAAPHASRTVHTRRVALADALWHSHRPPIARSPAARPCAGICRRNTVAGEIR